MSGSLWPPLKYSSIASVTDESSFGSNIRYGSLLANEGWCNAGGTCPFLALGSHMELPLSYQILVPLGAKSSPNFVLFTSIKGSARLNPEAFISRSLAVSGGGIFRNRNRNGLPGMSSAFAGKLKTDKSRFRVQLGTTVELGSYEGKRTLMRRCQKRKSPNFLD